MPSYGVTNIELNWFENYLFQRYQTVSCENEKSEKQPVFCGVPQGSILGPILFLMFFNDFVDCIKHAEVIKFADDTVIYFSNSNFHVIENS